MGISRFFQFFNDAKRDIYRNKLRGKIIPVDAQSVIYKHCIAIRKNGGDIITDHGKNKSHIIAIVMHALFMLRNDIIPVYVFDGKPPKSKDKTIDKRKEKKERAYAECTQCIRNKDDYIKNLKSSLVLERWQLSECQELLEAMGIPVVQSLGEADPQCVALAKSYRRDIYGILTDDSDFLVFGASRILLGMTSKSYTVYEMNHCDVMRILQERANQYGCTRSLTHSHLVDFCILLGCDYIDDILYAKKKITPESTLKLLVDFDWDVPTLVQCMQMDPNYRVPMNYIEQWYATRTYYLNATIQNPQSINIELKEHDYIKMLNILCNVNDFEYDTITRIVTALTQKRERQQQNYNSFIFDIPV